MKRLGTVLCFFVLGLAGCGGATNPDQVTPPATDGGAQSACGPITQGGLGGIGAQCSIGFFCGPQEIFDCAPGLVCCVTFMDKPGSCIDAATDGGAPHCLR